LANSRTGAVEVALSRGAYVRLGPDWVMLAGPAAPFGPLSLVVEGIEEALDELAAGSPARLVAGQSLVLDSASISLERTRPRAMIALDHGVLASAAAVGAAAVAARAALPELAAPIMGGVKALAAGLLREGARALAGAGEGLTPAGDDVLAGYAAAALALGRPTPTAVSALAARRAAPLGLAYLRCAERGELPDVAARLLLAIRRGSHAGVEAALPGLEAWGASSGSAIAWGMTTAASRHLTVKSTEREEEPCHAPDSGWVSTCSRMRRSSTLPPLMECSRSRGGTTRSSTPS
jgi:hypothetical protein